jgi:adenylate kinase family enzyme
MADNIANMKRVAVFGNAGAGKSTLARRLADLTRLPLYAKSADRSVAGHAAPRYVV